MFKVLAASAVALGLSASAEPACAQYLKDSVAKHCAGYTYATAIQRVGSCTSVIEGRDRTDKGRSWAYAYRAGAYYELRKLDLALADANRAIDLWPERPQGYVIRAAILTSFGRTDEALTDLDRVVKEDGGYPAYLARGHAYFQKQDYDHAQADFTAALDRMPNSASALMGRGKSYNAQRRYAEAAKDFSAAITYAPQEPRLWFGRAVAYDGLGQGDAALADLRRAASAQKALGDSEPGPPVSWWILANALFRHGDLAGALEADDQAVATRPSAETYNSRCWRRGIANRDLAAARSDCDRALELAPGAPEILDSRGFVRFRAGDWTGALADTDAALLAAPKSASSLYVRGLAKAALGRPQDAESDLASAEAIQPGIAREYAGYGVTP